MIDLVKSNFYKKNLLILILLYILTRLLFYIILGIKADPKVIEPGWHIIELSFLNNDLFNSLLHLHSQPPLWNALIGIFTKTVNGDLIKTSIILNIFNYFLTIGIIIYTYKILLIFNFKEKISFIIILFLIVLNPNVIFYENITFYTHALNFLFVNLFWLIISYFKTKKNIYEILIYLNITIQSLIWAGIHPILIFVVFITISILKKSIKNKCSIYFILIFLVSLSPSIKNKIIFNKFSSSTWLGINLSSTLNSMKTFNRGGVERQCLYQIIYPDYYETYKKEYKRDINHPIARSNSGKAYRNSVSQIILSDKCLKISIDQIKKTPIDYLKGRFLATIVSHSKFGFEYLYLSPINFSFYDIKVFLDKNILAKRIKQIIIILYMILFYIFILKKILNKNKFQKSLLIIFIIYLFCNTISHLFNGYEQERFMYQFMIMHLIFISSQLQKLNFGIFKE